MAEADTGENRAIGKDEISLADGESGIEGPPQVISHSFSISVGQGIPQSHKLVPGLALIENSLSLSNSRRQIAFEARQPRAPVLC